MNRVTLIGRLTKDPEMRVTPNGVSVTSFTLAVNRPFSNQNGENQADFINCICWRKTAENVANFLKKGSLAGVDGRLQTRTYENQTGNKVFVTEVVAENVQFLEPRKNKQGSEVQSNQYPNQKGNNNYPNYSNNANGNYYDPYAGGGSNIPYDDDVPF